MYRYWKSHNSVGCLWHSHGKNPVRLYPKLQSQPIGLPKIFSDYFFFQVDQWDCTKPLSICDRFACSDCTQNCKASQQDCVKSLSIISSSKSTNGIVQNFYRFVIDWLPLKNVSERFIFRGNPHHFSKGKCFESSSHDFSHLSS